MVLAGSEVGRLKAGQEVLRAIPGCLGTAPTSVLTDVGVFSISSYPLALALTIEISLNLMLKI